MRRDKEQVSKQMEEHWREEKLDKTQEGDIFKIKQETREHKKRS